MKSIRQTIKEAKHAISQRFQNLQFDAPLSETNELNAFDLMYIQPLQFTGMIEDYLFKENAEIFKMLEQQTDQDIEGLTYNEIKLDQAKQIFYQNVKSNIPRYYSLKPSDRQKHFQIQGEIYLQKMAAPSQSSSVIVIESPKKSKIQMRDPTPMKTIKISKKQALNNKKLSKKNKQNIKQKPQLIHQNSQISSCQQQKLNTEQNDENENIFSTPKKRMKQKKTVKFFQFEYVKDFSQYKTPRHLQSLQEYIEPLKEIKLMKKQEQ